MSVITPAHVDAATVADWLAEPDAVTVIDVRSPTEFETAHIGGSYNVPLDLLGEHAHQLAARLDRRVVLVCQSGARAAQARQRLARVGAQNLHVLDGGVPGYAVAGGQVVHGRAHWSLERQVRLVAGSLVLAGVAGGLRFPKASLLAGGVGAGLAVSALTDSCTMGRVLAALPHNNRGSRRRTAAQVLDLLPDPQPDA